MVYATLVEAKPLAGSLRNGIKESHALDKATVACIAAVGNHYVIERALLRTGSC